MTDVETELVEAAIRRVAEEYENFLVQKARRVEPTKEELRGGEAADVRVFEVPSLNAELKQLRGNLFAELNGVLGEERFGFFANGLQSRIASDERPELRSGTILGTAHRRTFYKPTAGANSLPMRVSAGGGSMYSSQDVDSIQKAYAAELQDWMILARTKPEKTVRNER